MLETCSLPGLEANGLRLKCWQSSRAVLTQRPERTICGPFQLLLSPGVLG